MTFRAFRFQRNPERWLVVLPCLFLVSAATPASAVENIRRVVWDVPSTVAWSPGRTTTKVTFDATLTQVEIAYAVTSFTVAVKHLVGMPETLCRYTVGPLPAGLPAGTSARFQVEFTMSCDPYVAKFDVSPGVASMNYLHPSRGEMSNRIGVVAARKNTTFGGSSFGLAVSDMNGSMHPLSLPSDAFACPAAPGTGSIGVYFDPDGNFCQGTIPAGTTGKVYIVAKLESWTADGIAGAEFRFTGVPEAWEVYAVPNPEIVAIGDPFANGVAAGFICQPPVAGKVLLYTVVVIAHEDVSDVRFEIQPRVPPLSGPCPMLLACDDPIFTKWCVDGLACFVNATTSTPCVVLAVEDATWSTVKALYR